MGRPSKEKRRDHQLNLSLYEDEYIDAYWRAHRAGMRLAEYGRACLRNGANITAAPSKIESPAPDIHLLQDIKRIGNNLNQMVRICHATKSPPPPSLEGLLEQIRELINRGVPG